MKQLIFSTSNNWAPTVLRVVLGITMLFHSISRLSMEDYGQFAFFFTEYLHLPIFLVWFTIAIESLGGLLLILGFATHINATLFFGLFMGVIALVHWDIGYSMDWWGQLEAGQEGFEYHMPVLAMSAAMAIHGGGARSLDLHLSNLNKVK